MCDELDAMGCEVVDDMYLTISNLEMTIVDLKSELEVKYLEIQELRKVYPYPYGSSGK